MIISVHPACHRTHVAHALPRDGQETLTSYLDALYATLHILEDSEEHCERADLDLSRDVGTVLLSDECRR